VPARDLPRDKLTPADDLRELLRRSELKAVALKGAGQEAVRFLKVLDQIHALFQTLEERGVDLRAEQTRWETVQRQIDSQAKTLVREVETQGGLDRLREAEHPSSDRWWWFLDRQVRRHRQRALRRFLVGGGIALVVLAIAAVLYGRFLAPDPKTQQAYKIGQQAERAVRQGDLGAALAAYEALYRLRPDDAEASLWLGALYEELGQGEKANQAFARARLLLADEGDFFARRGMIHLELERVESALADAEKAIAHDPESTVGHLVLGSALEAQGRFSQAVTALEKAASLADAEGNSSLYALIQIRLAVLLQGGRGPTP
jgi:cytochrome c-type biogenesis protein CcmH/NrfG